MLKRVELENYFSVFLKYLSSEKNLSQNSLRAYKADLKDFFLFWSTAEASLPSGFSAQAAAKKYRANLIKNGVKKTTIARKVSCLNTFEGFLASEGLSVEFKIFRPHVPLISPKHLNVQEVNHLLDNVSHSELSTRRPIRDKAILELLYATGIRASELIAIKIKDLDMENKTILVRGPRQADRTVFLSENAKKRVLDYLARERGGLGSPNEFLFLNYRSQPLTTRSLQRICNMFAIFLGKNRTVTPQILRHSFAVHMVDQGADLKDLKKILGFRSPLSIEKYIK